MHLGLTGGIGSGKSTVGSMFEALGAALIDSDAIARSTTAPGGAAMPAIRERFGAGFVDQQGALDRQRMRELVFAQPEARAQLEAIVHPLVSEHSAQKAAAATKAGSPLIVFDVPLLVESGRWTRRLDAVVVVDCDRTTQIDRVVRRNGLAREAVEAILVSQASPAARRAVADVIINNRSDCTLECLHRQVRETAALFGL